MNLIFDTSVLIEIDKGNKRVIERIFGLAKEYPSPAKICFISYFEFLYGLKNKSEKSKRESKDFIENFNVIGASKETAHLLVTLKENYELSLSDLLIASNVIEENGILVTMDKDFSIIKEMKSILL